MNAWENLLFFMSGFLLSMALLGLAIAVIMPFIDRWNKSFFIILFFILALCMASKLVDAFVCMDPAMIIVEKAAWFFESLFASVSIPMFTFYLLHCCGNNRKGRKLLGAVISLWVIYFILLIFAQFTTCFYYITPDKQFMIGSWYSLLIAPLIVCMVLNLLGVVNRRSRLSKMNLCAFLLFLLPLTVALMMHIFVVNFMVIEIGVTISVFSMFFVVLVNQNEQHMSQQQEIARQQASIMVLQMRPHFIFNTMMSIYYLCEQDMKKARQVTLDFTTYLRRNFTAIASNHTIPFADELEHTRAYLSVEQASFEERLIVEYNITHNLFRLPPLTLQPIVENAVKHGMDPDSDPLYVTIRTYHMDSHSVIIVEDNGPGFEMADNSQSCTTLTNIRQRLKLMCKGKMEITSRNGGGTKVTITVPDNSKVSNEEYSLEA